MVGMCKLYNIHSKQIICILYNRLGNYNTQYNSIQKQIMKVSVGGICQAVFLLRRGRASFCRDSAAAAVALQEETAVTNVDSIHTIETSFVTSTAV